MTTMIGTVASVLFVLILLRAGIGDLVTMKIPNKLSLMLLAGYAFLIPFAGLSPVEIAFNLVAALIVFCLGFCAFARGWMGGGDVKLITVSVLWLGLPLLPAFLFWTAVFGAILTATLLYYRFLPLTDGWLAKIGWAGRLHADETHVPYGVAISAAALMVFLWSPWMAPLLNGY